MAQETRRALPEDLQYQVVKELWADASNTLRARKNRRLPKSIFEAKIEAGIFLAWRRGRDPEFMEDTPDVNRLKLV